MNHFEKLVRYKTDLAGYHFRVAYCAAIYQDRYDYANARPLVWKDGVYKNDQKREVFSFSKTTLQSVASGMIPGGKKRWRLKLHKVIILVTPDKSTLYQSAEDYWEEVKVLDRPYLGAEAAVGKFVWRDPPF